MAPHNLPPSRGARWRRKAFSLVSVAAIAAALTLSGGASASADDTGTAETSAVQTTQPTEPSVEPVPDKESDPTTTQSDPEVPDDEVVETPESEVEDPAPAPEPAPEPEPAPAPAPEEEEVVVEDEGEAPAETFAQLLAPETEEEAKVAAALPTINLVQGSGCISLDVSLSGDVPADLQVDAYLTYGDSGNPFGTPLVPVGPGIVSGQNYSVSFPLSSLPDVAFGPYPIYGFARYAYGGQFPVEYIEVDSSCYTSPPVVTHVTPTTPTFVDNGDGTGTVTIPATQPGVQYQIDGVNQGPGTYPVTGSGSVSAVPTGEDYVLDGTTSWPFSFVQSETKPITGKAYTDHGCDSTEWHFVITGVDDPAHAPASIHVVWADGSEADVPLDKVSGKVAHYATTDHLDSAVVSISTDIYTEWDGQFNVSHGPCDTPDEDTPVSAGEVQFTDPCGTANDTYLIPATTGVEYLVNNVVVAAGTYPGTGTVTIVAQALPTYKLVGESEQSGTFTDVPCEHEDTPVSAGEVIFTDPCGTENDTYTIPTTVGVEYLVGNVVVAAGTYPGTGTVTVVARALPTYKLVGNAEQSGAFTDYLCPLDEGQLTTVVGGCGVVVFTNNADQTVEVLFGDYDLPGPDGSVVIEAGQSVTVATSRALLDWIAYTSDNFLYAGSGEDVAVQQDCDVPPPVVPEPPVAPVPPVVYVPVPADVIPAPVVWVNVVVQAAAPAAVDAAPAVVDDVYPTGSENGGFGDRIPVGLLAALFLGGLALLGWAIRKPIRQD